MSIPAEQVGGTQNVIAICPPDVNTSKVAEDRDSVLLRLRSKEEVKIGLFVHGSCHGIWFCVLT